MFNKEALLKELDFKAIRSSGSGGQHVNKVSSKVELTFNLQESQALSDLQKNQLIQSLNTKLTNNFVLLLQCGESRSQHKNKQIIIQRFFDLIEKGLYVPKKRKPTKIPKAVVAKRLKNKSAHSEKKANRKKPDFD